MLLNTVLLNTVLTTTTRRAYIHEQVATYKMMMKIATMALLAVAVDAQAGTYGARWSFNPVGEVPTCDGVLDIALSCAAQVDAAGVAAIPADVGLRGRAPTPMRRA